MSMNDIFDIAGSGMRAETSRLSASAANMTNVNSLSGSKDETYKPQYPVFKAIQAEAMQWDNTALKGGVVVTDVIESTKDPLKTYSPNHPMADAKGFVYAPDINHVEEMANMISATRSYQMNIEMLNNVKQLMQKTLHMGE